MKFLNSNTDPSLLSSWVLPAPAVELTLFSPVATGGREFLKASGICMAGVPRGVELLPLKDALDCFFLKIQFFAQEKLSNRVHTSREVFAVRICGLLVL